MAGRRRVDRRAGRRRRAAARRRPGRRRPGPGVGRRGGHHRPAGGRPGGRWPSGLPGAGLHRRRPGRGRRAHAQRGGAGRGGHRQRGRGRRPAGRRPRRRAGRHQAGRRRRPPSPSPAGGGRAATWPSSASGPGDAAHRTPAAEAAVRRAEVVIGYGPYVDACADLLTAGQEVVRSPIGDETVRAKQALAEAGAGRRVALVCSGDAGVYAMASLVLEVAGDAGVDVEVVPGRDRRPGRGRAAGRPARPRPRDRSACPTCSRRGRPSRPGCGPRPRPTWSSPSTTPAAGAGRGSSTPPATSCSAHRPPTTPVGVVTDAGRPGQPVQLTTLGGGRRRRRRHDDVRDRRLVDHPGDRRPHGHAPGVRARDRRHRPPLHRLRRLPGHLPGAGPGRRAPPARSSLVDRCTTCLACVEVCPVATRSGRCRMTADPPHRGRELPDPGRAGRPVGVRAAGRRRRRPGHPRQRRPRVRRDDGGRRGRGRGRRGRPGRRRAGDRRRGDGPPRHHRRRRRSCFLPASRADGHHPLGRRHGRSPPTRHPDGRGRRRRLRPHRPRRGRPPARAPAGSRRRW